jgi:hypothetical protein
MRRQSRVDKKISRSKADSQRCVCYARCADLSPGSPAATRCHSRDVTFLNSSPNGKETYYIDDQLFMYRIVLAMLEASLVASFPCRRVLLSFV